MATKSLLLLFVQKLLRFLEEAGESLDRFHVLSLMYLLFWQCPHVPLW